MGWTQTIWSANQWVQGPFMPQFGCRASRILRCHSMSSVGVQLCIRDNTLGGYRSKLRWGSTSCAIFRARGANLCELGCALTLLVAPEVSVLAARREISLGKRKGDLGRERDSLECHREISALSLIFNLFCKKIAEMFSIQEPGAEFVPSWFPAETATSGAPFYSCDKCQSVAQALPRCGVLLDPQASLSRGLQQEKLIPL